MAANLGDIVSTLTLDRRQFQTGMEAASKELGKVRGEITKMAAESAKGNAQSALSLVRLIEKEEELAATAKRAADIEKRAREGVLLHRREELHVLAMQEQAERKVTAAIQQRAFYVQRSRAGGGGGMAGGGLGTGLAFGLSDAATAYQFGGARSAALAISNNLPMIGMGLADIGAKAAAAGGSMARFGGILSKFAGPAGMALSVILPLGAGLASYALDAKKAADATETLAANLAAAAARREAGDRLAGLRKGEGLDSQKGRVADASGRLSDIDTEIFMLRTGITKLQGSDNAGLIADLERQLDAALSQRMGIAAEVETERRALREGQAGLANRRTPFDGSPSAEQHAAAEVRRAQQRLAPQRSAQAEAARAAMLEGDSVGLALVNGLRRRLNSLMGQGQARGGPSLNLPELATRGNSVDRIIDIAKGKAEAAQEARAKRAEEADNRKIRLLQDLIDAVQEQRGLKPAGL
jgi:hypothetical protein